MCMCSVLFGVEPARTTCKVWTSYLNPRCTAGTLSTRLQLLVPIPLNLFPLALIMFRLLLRQQDKMAAAVDGNRGAYAAGLA